MNKRGFTLLEMMMAVAIIGMMTALAVVNFQSVVERGRVNGMAQDLARILADGRIRSIAMACRISVQINGPRYNPGVVVPPMPNTAQTIIVFRKNVCDPATLPAPNDWFEAGDHIITTLHYDPTGAHIFVPGVLGTEMLNDSVIFSWGLQNGVLTRTADLDSGGSGNFTALALAGIDQPINIASSNGTMVSSAWVLNLGAPYAQ